MKANHDTIPTVGHGSADVSTVRSRRLRGAVAGVVALVVLGACTSDPGPRRVAQDIIEAEADAAAERGEDFPKECMLDALDEFSDDELSRISSDLAGATAEQQESGREELERYQSALEACKN